METMVLPCALDMMRLVCLGEEEKSEAVHLANDFTYSKIADLMFWSRIGRNWQLFPLFSTCNLVLTSLFSKLLIFNQNSPTDIVQENFLVY